MRRSVFRQLHDVLVANYGLQSTCQMSSVESLALFLWMLGAPESNSQAADRFERSVSTVSNKFHHVLDCVDRMAGDYIRPNDPNFTEPHAKLRHPRFWPHFKDAIGAIDGTHIRVTVAEKLKVQYTNRKGYTSQNVLAICDFDMRFTFVVAGWPGSVHDTRVWTDARPHFPNYPHPPIGNLFSYKIFFARTYYRHILIVCYLQENTILLTRDTQTKPVISPHSKSNAIMFRNFKEHLHET